MNTLYASLAGNVELAGTREYHNENFGYTLFEEVVDPANPEGPRAIAMHVPAHSLSKVWELVEPDYSERIELLSGTASLVVNRAGTEDWTTMPLDLENPTADGIEIGHGDMFCIVTEEDEAVVLSRPSKRFDISFEVSRTKSPQDALSQFLVAHVATTELSNAESESNAELIRPASAEDLDDLTVFLEAAYADTYPNNRGITRDMFEGNAAFQEELKTYFEEQLANSSASLYLVKKDEKIIGTVGVRPTEDSSVVELWGFYVAADLHGNDLASNLYATAMQSDQVNSAEKVRLSVAKDAERAKAFYEKQGFIVTDEEDWDWPHWTEEHPHNQYWIMEKKLRSP